MEADMDSGSVLADQSKLNYEKATLSFIHH